MPRVKSKVTFQTILNLCEERGWTTLETEYINANTTMSWKCNTCGFVWKCNYNNTRKRQKCSRCQKGSSKYSHEEVCKIGLKKGYELLDNYTRNDIPLLWKCVLCKYEWKTSFANINREERGDGCPSCNGVGRYKYEDIVYIAKQKNLTCLDTEYSNCNVHMNWQCNKCGRVWATSFRSILQNSGCIDCSFDENVKCGMDDVFTTIKDRDIECLDSVYKNSNAKMNWKCKVCDNIWQAEYHHIKHSKSGCPNCAAYRSQKACRKIFEKIMGEPFPTLRPKFLKGLEYDGYNSDLKLAFEYQGLQHYRFVPFFQKEVTSFEHLLQNDAEKRRLSVEYGITLIEIPYNYTYKDKDELFEFILKELEETGFAVSL